MSSRGASALLSRASRIRSKLQTALEATVLEVDDVSYQHAGHAAVKGSSDKETHFNVKIVSPKFEGQSLVKRHRLVYDLLAEELQSGLHALSIVAKTLHETNPNNFIQFCWEDVSLDLKLKSINYKDDCKSSENSKLHFIVWIFSGSN
ncbi:Protein BOLA1, chloroplastic [Glycine max]|nr:Protein BOLA1, chloroplastic [Glycine max]